MKLVRNKMEDDDTRPVESKRELLMLLRTKVMEEAAEVATAFSREELIEELADLVDVAQAIMYHYDIDESLVIAASRLKADKKGNFNTGLVWTPGSGAAKVNTSKKTVFPPTHFNLKDL